MFNVAVTFLVIRPTQMTQMWFGETGGVRDEVPSPSGATSHDTAVVMLAAGAGSRFEATVHKLFARLTATGPTILETSLRHAIESDVGPVFVVTGALDASALSADRQIARLLDDPRIQLTHNPSWADGQAGSLRVATDAATAAGHDAIVVGLADQPFITPEGWRAVADGLGAITVATYDGRRGNPVKLHASVWGLLPASGDEGARVLMRRRPDLVVEVPCSGSPADIDTVEDLHQWQNN